MATYIALCHFTDQGIRSVKDTTHRAAAVREAGKKYGADMQQVYWTLGRYDLVTIIDAKDDATATAFALAVSSAGNVRMETLRAFDTREMSSILDKLS